MIFLLISTTEDSPRGSDETTRRILADIAARAKVHEPEAFSEIFDLFFEKLRRYMYYKTGDLHMAEDLAAETLAKGFENIDSFTDRGGTIGAWLFGIARNLMAREREASAKIELLDLDTGVSVPEEKLTDEVVIVAIEHEELYETLAELPEEQREVVLLRFMERYDVGTVAKIMGKKPGAVRALQFRAIKTLRDLLSSR